MTEHGAADRMKRLFRMMLFMWWGALAGGFIFLRSVDPAGVEDERWARAVGDAFGRAAGLPAKLNTSAAAVGAGLRDEIGRKAEKKEGKEVLTIDQDNALVVCRATTAEGLDERLFARLFGVDDPNNRDVTAEAYALLGDEAAGLATASDVLVLSSEEAAMEAVQNVQSDRYRACLARALTNDGSAAWSPAGTEPVSGGSLYRLTGAADGTAPSPGVVPSAELVVLRRGRSVAVLHTRATTQPFPPELQARLATELSSSLGAGPDR